MNSSLTPLFFRAYGPFFRNYGLAKRKSPEVGPIKKDTWLAPFYTHTKYICFSENLIGIGEGVLKPGGRLIVTTVNSHVSHRGYFKFFADWNLVLRSSADLLGLAERFTPEAERWLKSCPETGANDYLYLQRPS